MKRNLLVGIALLLSVYLFADEPVKAIHRKIVNPANKEVTVVAHRQIGGMLLKIQLLPLKVPFV